MNKPNKFKKWLWVAVIGTIIAILIPISKVKQMLRSKPATEVITHDQSGIIDSLKAVIDLYKEDNVELSHSINRLNGQVSDLKQSISNREATIKLLKQSPNEKINNVSNFTNSDIYKLLSDRYKDSTSVN